MIRSLLFALAIATTALVASLAPETAHAQGAPCQWAYANDANGNAQATYCGNVKVNGQILGLTGVVNTVATVPALATQPATGPVYVNNVGTYYPAATCPLSGATTNAIACVQGTGTVWVLGQDASPNINLVSAGALNSPSTPADSTAAIVNAFTAANVNNGSNILGQLNLGVDCPSGSSFWITQTIVVPYGTGLVGPQGSRSRSCIFNVISGSTIANGVFNIINNPGPASVFGTRVDSVTVNMNQQNGVAFYGTGLQDKAGFNDDFAYQVQGGPCFVYDGTTAAGSVNTFEHNRNECWGSQSRTAGGNGMQVNTGGSYPYNASDNDVLGYTGHAWTNYIQLVNNLNAQWYNTTLEVSGGSPGSDPSTNGITFTGSGSCVLGVHGATSQYLGSLVFVNSSCSGGATAVIDGIYAIGPGAAVVAIAAGCGPQALNVADIRPVHVTCGNNSYDDVTNEFHYGGLSIGNAATNGGAKGVGTVNAVTYWANGTTGVTCAGAPTAAFASSGGVVTHC